jgi:hypothetical protein
MTEEEKAVITAKNHIIIQGVIFLKENGYPHANLKNVFTDLLLRILFFQCLLNTVDEITDPIWVKALQEIIEQMTDVNATDPTLEPID